MFCVYLEMPYERQIKRLYPDFLSLFMESINEIAYNNGGTVNKHADGYFYCFSENEIAYSFFTSRFLFLISAKIKEAEDKINEIRIIADRFETERFSDIISDLFCNLKSSLLPLNGIFATAKIVKSLRNYISFASLKNNTLRECKSFEFFEKNLNKENKEKINKNSIIVHKDGNYLYSVYNFILQNPLSETCLKFFNNMELKSYLETKSCLKFLSENRFSKKFPQYFIDAFLIHSSLHLKAYVNSIKSKTPVSVYIDDIYDSNNFSEGEKILRMTPASEIKTLAGIEPDTDKIPDDLFDLMYLTVFAAKYIFVDEQNSFFSELNRLGGIQDVIKIMYNNGIILIADNIDSYPPEMFKTIEKKIRFRRKNLNILIGSFLWKKYKMGFFKPSAVLKEILTDLNYDFPEELTLTSFFYQHKDSAVLLSDIEIFKNCKFYDALKMYFKTLENANEYEFKKALVCAKRTVSEFQKYHFLSGEYRSLSLLGFLNMKEKKITDAATYFRYASDCAEQSKRNYLICESLFNLSTAYFLQRNFKKAFLTLHKLSYAVSKYFLQEWKIPCLFLQGRIYLELGEFKKAEIMFNSAADFASLYFSEKEALCRVWAARSYIYEGQVFSAQKILEENIDKTPDAVLFLLESYLFRPVFTDDFSEYGIDTNNLFESRKEFLLNDFENFNSGFYLFEDLLLNKKEDTCLGKNIFTAFYNYYKFRLQPSAEISSSLQSIKKLENLAMKSLYEKDFEAPLYLYLSYDSYLRGSEEYKSKASAFLSKAFKALQQNVAGITENDVRDKFMQKNAWNSKIYKAARENKLI